MATTTNKTRREAVEIAGVRLTHPDRVLYRDAGLSKRGLAAYFVAAGERILPHVAGRLLSLVRCPEGERGACFFQKHPGQGLPAPIRIAAIEERKGTDAHYLYIENVAGLVGLAQIGTLEIHLWGSSVDDIERPDRLVLDIDPDVGLPFAETKRAARRLQARLEELGIASFALVTGGKGVHVVAPLMRRQGWAEVKAFARGLASELESAEPDRYVAQASKARRRGRVFIDYLRNDRGSTAIAPYSTRARPGAPVAMPVTWDELGRLSKPGAFDVGDALARVRKADPWEGYFELRQSISRRALDAVGARDV